MGQLKYWNTATSTWDSVDVGGNGGNAQIKIWVYG